MKEMKESSIFSMARLNYFFHSHPGLVTTIFLESNLMVLTYPLQSIKTRIQSRHFKYDLCHFQKNNVEKTRKLVELISSSLRNTQRLHAGSYRKHSPLLYKQVCRLLHYEAQDCRVLSWKKTSFVFW